MSRCRSCGAEIIWARTRSGSRMPVTLAQRRDGNLVLAQEDSYPGAMPVAEAYDPEKHQGWGRHVSHFADCPNAASHRRKR